MDIFSPLPNVILIGETNVGKSSIFNKIIGTSISVVGDTEDLTRDVIIGTSSTGMFNMVDLPGVLNVQKTIEFVEKVENIHGFCLVIDDKGWNKVNSDLLRFALQSGKKVVVVANKEENIEAYLGKKDVTLMKVSVMKGTGLKTLNEFISNWFKNSEEIDSDAWSIVGRSNVGKSTLLNKMLGKERFLVKDEIGTTQEVHGVYVEHNGRKIHLFDTPGYRKNNDLSDLEKASQYRLDRMLKAKSSVFVVLIDTTQGISKTDLLIMDRLWSAGRGIVVALGMWDIVNDTKVLHNAKQFLQDRFNNVPCISVSGTSGFGIQELIKTIEEVEENMKFKVGTSRLNKWLDTIRKKDIFNLAGIKYMTQVGSNPPTFFLFASREVDDPKKRYLTKNLANYIKCVGVPLKLIFKVKEKRYSKK